MRPINGIFETHRGKWLPTWRKTIPPLTTFCLVLINVQIRQSHDEATEWSSELVHHFIQCRTHRRGIGVRPLEREGAAFIGLDRVDATEVVGGQVGARAVGTTSEHEAFAIGRKLRLAFDELGFAHAEKRGDADNFGIRHADNTVLDPAARPASPTLEITFHWSLHALSIEELRAGLGTVSAKALLAKAMNAAVAKRTPGPKRSQIQPPSNA